MRPAETYRGARRNLWREEGCPDWSLYKISGSNWNRAFETQIINKPALTRGWNYRHANRALINQVRAMYAGGRSVTRWLANLIDRDIKAKLAGATDAGNQSQA